MKWKTRGQRLILALLVVSVLGVAVSWVQSYGGTPHGVSWRMSDARYTLRAIDGRVELRGPPPAPAAAEAAARVVSRLSWTDFDWPVSVHQMPWPEGSVEPVPSFSVNMIWPPTISGTPGAEAVGNRKDPAMTRALLDALDDPNRFALAHICLAANGPKGVDDERQQGDRLAVGYQGLTFELQVPVGPRIVSDNFPGRRPRIYRRELGRIVRARVVTPVDSRQIPDLRTKWHDLLDVRHAAVPHWVIITVLSAPSGLMMLRVVRTARHRWRRARGECEACGYDLRASSGRCPECGEEPRRGAGEVPPDDRRSEVAGSTAVAVRLPPPVQSLPRRPSPRSVPLQ